jgi:hypothetical protein
MKAVQEMISLKIKSYKDILSDETGQDALQISMKFNQKILVIKKQLE